MKFNSAPLFRNGSRRLGSAVAAGIVIAWVTLGACGYAATPVQYAPPPLHTVTPDLRHGEVLYLQHCTECHGRHAWGDGPRAIPALAGQRKAYLTAQLASFVASERDSESMHETMRRPDVNWPESVRDVAAYLTQARRSPHPEYGEGRSVVAGQRLYQTRCVECHGPSGEGRSEQSIPAIGGQHYRYLLEQLTNFSEGHRRDTNHSAIHAAASLTQTERQQVADFLSRLPYLTADSNP